MISALLLLSTAHAQGFDWGSDCASGSGQFQQFVARSQTTHVGTIPDDRRNVFIALDATTDVDIQLVDAATGHPIIAWPNGDLNGAGPACAYWQGIYACYSGYNGDGGLGKEWILVQGDTQRRLEMRAFGYAAGNADVSYRYQALPTCRETGTGAFYQPIPYYNTVDVGTIPAGMANVEISMNADAGRDIDIQLYDGAHPIVQWPNGDLNGATEQSIQYNGATITWSGYNGVGGDWGNEFIRIEGELPSDFQVKAFGYQSGTARVDYGWGEGAGDTCGGIAWLQCDDGYMCKNWQQGVSDPAGSCHVSDWCMNDQTAHDDCQHLQQFTMRSEYWGCRDYTCEVRIGLPYSCPAEIDCSTQACDVRQLAETCPDTHITFGN